MITVLITTHNRHAILGKCLQSVYMQTVLPHEIVLVDDESNPPVGVEIFESCPAEIKTRLIRNERSRGASGSRNAGIRYATGNYIAFLDDDDEFFPEKVHRIKLAIIENNYPDFIYHGAEIIMKNEGVSYITCPKTFHFSVFFQRMLVANEVGGTPMVVCKTEALHEVGLFDESLPALEDYELWLRMVKNGCSFVALKEALTKYFYLAGSASVSKHVANNARARRLISEKYRDDYALLDKGALVRWREAIEIDNLQRFLLNHNYLRAVGSSVKIFGIRPRLTNLLRFFVVIFGSRAAFRVRSWI